MKRTQIYIDQRQVAKLKAAARASHQTVSEIIRDAIDEKLARPDEKEEFDIVLARASGIWADRNDLGTTDQYVRKLREDRRGQPAK